MDETEKKLKEEQGKAWLAFFTETNLEIRARRIAEYTYIAASIAAFGALAWGVASINPTCDRQLPVLAAVLAIILIVFSVLLKIIDEHFKHFKLSKEAIRLAKKITDAYEIVENDVNDVPKKFKGDAKSGTGHLWSALVLEFGGLGAILFCISIGFPERLICTILIGFLIVALSLIVILILDKIKS